MFLCFWSDSKYLFTIFLVPPLIHTQKTYTNLTLCIVIHILFHISLITNDSCRTTKHYHIKQRYIAITALLTLITPLIGRINTPARSHAPVATASIHQSTRPPIPHQLAALCRCQPRLYSISPAASKHQVIAIRPVNLHNDPTTASVSTPASYHKRYKNTVKRR